jgi:catechol 2,3-dioxygenase-like lactoylglutathione lyase family enzyme
MASRCVSRLQGRPWCRNQRIVNPKGCDPCGTRIGRGKISCCSFAENPTCLPRPKGFSSPRSTSRTWLVRRASTKASSAFASSAISNSAAAPWKRVPRQVLLLFKKGASRAITSPHDGDGELHLAFAIEAAELSRWESWLAENGIALEEKRTWERGGTSLYFRDPDRHLIEIATPGVWSTY